MKQTAVIKRIALDYHRMSKIKLGDTPEYVSWNYSERLVIDRETSTIEHICIIGDACKVSRKYETDGVGEGLLEQFDAEHLFSHIEGNPEDVIEPSDETRDYVITIDFENHPQRIIQGSYDKNGLPSDFAGFIEAVFDFMTFYNMGELFSPSVYGRAKRRKSEHIFCSVAFEEGGKSYYYLTEDDSIEVGDLVLVPTGTNHRETVAEVVNIEYFCEEAVPFPIEQTKRIIRKHTNSD